MTSNSDFSVNSESSYRNVKSFESANKAPHEAYRQNQSFITEDFMQFLKSNLSFQDNIELPNKKG